MHGDDQTELRGAFHPGAQFLFIHRREIIDATVAHERLQTDDATITQCFELLVIAGNQSAPEREIDERLHFGSGALEIETPAIDRGRLCVERHFENGRRAARRCGARAGGESFPLGATRFVEVNMRIDDTGKDVELCRIDFLARRTGKIFPERDELSFANSDIAARSRGQANRNRS